MLAQLGLLLALSGAVPIQGNGGTVAEVEANNRALRITGRPIDVGSLGSYRIGVQSGLTAGLAANTPIFSFRWGDATRLALVRYIKVTATVITGFTAAQEIAADCILARSFTASDSAGTAVTLTGNNAKKRTSMGTSLVTAARVAAAVALTAGTRTLDNQAFMSTSVKTLAAAATVQDARLEMVWDATHLADYPIILTQNEGFVCRNVIAEGAGGTVRYAVEVAWDEVASF